MKCTIAGPNIKTFAKVVHAFAKIGEDIYIQPFSQGLHLKSVNSSRSAYFCVTLMLPFFQHFNPNQNNETYSKSREDCYINANDNNNSQLITPPCKLTIRSVLLVFKSLASLEKQHIECFKLILKPDRNKAIFKVFCKFNILKSFHLSYMECDTLDAIIPDANLDSDDENSQPPDSKEINYQNANNFFSNSNIKNTQGNLYLAKFKSHPKLLIELISQFSSTVEEITFQLASDIFIVKNYQAEEEFSNTPLISNTQATSKKGVEVNSQSNSSTINHSKKTLDTEVRFYPHEFSFYKFNNIAPTISQNNFIDITFCIKEFKAALTFLEYVEADIMVRIDIPGKPLLLKSQIEHFYTATFLIATLAEMLVRDNEISQNSPIPPCSLKSKIVDKDCLVLEENYNYVEKEVTTNEIKLTNDQNLKNLEIEMDDELSFNNEISQICTSEYNSQPNNGTLDGRKVIENKAHNIFQNIISKPDSSSLKSTNQSNVSFANHDTPINYLQSQNKTCLIFASDSDEN